MFKKFLPFLALCFGSLCLGLIFVVTFINATEVDCTLQLDESYACQIRTLLFGKVQIFEKRVEHVVDIKIDSCSEGYRPEFVTSEGKQVPLSHVCTDRDLVLQQVNTLGSQIDSHVEQITYIAGPPWWLLFLICGLTLMAMLLSPLMLLIPLRWNKMVI